MKSTTGQHYIALDHVRAVAVYLVIAWHFMHGQSGYPVEFNYGSAIFPLALVDEGHTGVSLFMVLSGYLFAKLLDGRSIDVKSFLRNRLLRLIPLLVVVFALVGLRNVSTPDQLATYVCDLARGIYYPSWPNGGWSIAVELHFYLILPLLLWLFQRSLWWALAIIGGATFLRGIYYALTGEVNIAAYFTIMGRIDQFVIGIAAFRLRSHATGRHVIAVGSLLLLGTLFWYLSFDFGKVRSFRQPSTHWIWVCLTTIEGTAYGIVIAWYETTFKQRQSLASDILGRIGTYSYSIYLLHHFFVFDAARIINRNIMHIGSLYRAMAWAALFLLCMLPVGYLSYHLIEAPFLRLRRSYVRASVR